jgi:PRC-barrel domain protein
VKSCVGPGELCQVRNASPFPWLSDDKDNLEERPWRKQQHTQIRGSYQVRMFRAPNYGAGDEAIGEIDHLLIEKLSGRVTYAVMSFGGFGLGHSHYPIPWAALK